MENSSFLVGIEQLFRPQPGQTTGDYASLTRCAVGLRRAGHAEVSNGKVLRPCADHRNARANLQLAAFFPATSRFGGSTSRTV